MRTGTSSFMKHMEENIDMLNSCVKQRICNSACLAVFSSPLSVSSVSNEIKCKWKLYA